MKAKRDKHGRELKGSELRDHLKSENKNKDKYGRELVGSESQKKKSNWITAYDMYYGSKRLPKVKAIEIRKKQV